MEEILHPQTDGWNPINNGTNYRLQLVQDFAGPSITHLIIHLSPINQLWIITNSIGFFSPRRAKPLVDLRKRMVLSTDFSTEFLLEFGTTSSLTLPSGYD